MDIATDNTRPERVDNRRGKYLPLAVTEEVKWQGPTGTRNNSSAQAQKEEVNALGELLHEDLS
jgi:hypothetical protein